MKDFLSSLLALWKQLGLNQRVSLGLAAILIFGVTVGLLFWSQRAEYRLLFGGLSEKDTAAIVSQLQGQGIPFKLEGSSVYVPEDDVHQQRMDLAGKGIPTGEGVGFEIFDQGQFGLSDFVQRTNYLRALQGELARTISQLNGVATARVMIVQPENRLLLTDQGVKSTASVFVELNHASLGEEAVNSIRHFVANAVQGLALDDVAVIDQKGRVLSEELRRDPLLGSAVGQMRYRQQVEGYLSNKVETMLSPVIGHGNAVVRVSVDIETASVVQTEERFDPEGQVLRSESIIENSTSSSETRNNATVGVSGNTPDREQDTAGPVAVNSEETENRTLNYEINRTLTNTTRNAGSITGVRAAVFVARRPPVSEGAAPVPRTQEEIEGLRQIVINALGLEGENAEELVTIREAVFQRSLPAGGIEAMQSPVYWEKYLDLAIRYSGVGVALLVLLIFVRVLKRQKPEVIPIEILREAEAPHSNNNGRDQSAFTPEMLNEMIRRKPANVSNTLREWVSNQSN